MRLTVYMDLVVLLNFLVDFLLLLGTNRLAGYPPNARKCALAALLGALYAACCMLPELFFLGNFLWRSVSLALMAVAAFGMNASAFQRGAVFLLLSMALGGIATGVNGRNFGALVLCALALWLLCRFAFRGGVGQREYVNVELSHDGKSVQVIALRDTGNTLRDPLSGEAVLVADASVAQRLLGLTREQLSHPIETIASGRLSGFRLIPYHTVGNGGSMMLAMRFRNVKIGGAYSDALVAFAPEQIGRGEVYQMLAGGAV